MLKIIRVPKVVECKIIRRETLFTVLIEVENRIYRALLRNTGRLINLIKGNSKAICIPKSHGKTEYILLGVEIKGDLCSILDTNYHMKVFEILAKSDIFPWIKDWSIEKRNPRAYDSVLDYLIKSGDKIGFLEIKSAIHSNGIYAMYPDAPSPRGIRHLKTLIKLKELGYRSVIVFIASYPGVKAFSPHSDISPKYAKLLREALSRGVEVYAFNIVMNSKGEVFLEKPHLPLNLPL